MDEQASAAEGERGHGHGWGIFVVLFGILVAYPLSVGPVMKLTYRKQAFPPLVVGVLYAPLQLLYQNSPVVKRFYDWYMRDVWKMP